MDQRQANRLAAGLTARLIRSHTLALARETVTGRDDQERVRVGLERLWAEMTRRSGSATEHADDSDQLRLFEGGTNAQDHVDPAA